MIASDIQVQEAGLLSGTYNQGLSAYDIGRRGGEEGLECAWASCTRRTQVLMEFRSARRSADEYVYDSADLLQARSADD